jgi:surfactin synthase thioesterase subunit
MDVSVPTLEALVEKMLRGLPDGGSGYDCLLGWSFGASLAIEMARRLEQRGQAVKLLLLDGMPCQIADPAISGEFEGFEVLAQRRYWSGVMNTLRRTMTDDQIVGLERMAGRNKSLWENYKVCVPINADILAVEARRPKSATKGMASLAQITHGKVRVVPTSGDHYSMFHPPHLHEWIVEAKIFLSGE